MLLALLVTFGFGVAFLVTRPYFLMRLNVLQGVLYISTVCMCMIGGLFYSNQFWLIDSWGRAFTIMAFIIIAGTTATFFVVIVYEILEWHAKISTLKRLEEACMRDPDSRYGSDGFNRDEVEAFVSVFHPRKLSRSV